MCVFDSAEIVEAANKMCMESTCLSIYKVNGNKFYLEVVEEHCCHLFIYVCEISTDSFNINGTIKKFLSSLHTVISQSISIRRTQR